MKKILLYLSAVALIMALFLTDCKKKPELKIYNLEISDEAVVSTTTKATITANYSYPSEIRDIKVVVGDNGDMQNASVIEASLENNSLSATVDNLSASTKYYYCFRYSNGMNIVDTDNRSFTTQSISLPEVTTKSVTNITSTSAQCGGEVLSDGGGTITSRGVCWSTENNPTINDAHTSDSIGLGAFTSYITGLDNEVTYYVRAYATNAGGTSYGEERSFTTQEGLAVISTNEITNITISSAVCGGNITDDGGFAVTSRGVCWSTSPNPVLNIYYMTTDGSGLGAFTSSITDLLPNTTYYVRAYATNSKGTSYGDEKVFTTNDAMPVVTTASVSEITSSTAICGGNVTSDGGLTVTSRGVCWSTSPNPVLNLNYMTTDGSGTGEFTSTITNLSPNTTYYVRAYASNSAGTSYGDQKTFTTAT